MGPAPQAYQAAVRGLLVLLILAGLNVVWMVPQLVYLGLQRPRLRMPLRPRGPSHVGLGNQGAARGWQNHLASFDELSYNQTFEHRFPGLDLPSFDDFKKQKRGVHRSQARRQ